MAPIPQHAWFCVSAVARDGLSSLRSRGLPDGLCTMIRAPKRQKRQVIALNIDYAASIPYLERTVAQWSLLH